MKKLTEDEYENWTPPYEPYLKPGEWNLILYKGRPTRWDYTLKNPSGGSSGMSSFTSARAAMASALPEGTWDFNGISRVWVIEVVGPYSADPEIKKTYWLYRDGSMVTESSKSTTFREMVNSLLA